MGRRTAEHARKRRTLQLDEFTRYEGAVDAAGRRCGRGTLVITDEDDGSESWVTGEWDDDELHGAACYTAADGSTVHGTYTRGSLDGRVFELAPNGTVRFVGEYASGARCGYGMELRADGGCLEGTWHDGSLEGTACAYHYPCPRGGALLGEWRAGVMMRARYVRLGQPPPAAPPGAVGACGEGTLPRLPGRGHAAPTLPAAVCINPVTRARALALARGESVSALPRPPPRGVAYASRAPRDVRTAARGAGTPAAGAPTAEPHERRAVYVAPSRVSTAAAGGAPFSAGLGLWARRSLRAGEVAAFFAGEPIGEEEAEERRAEPLSHTLVLGGGMALRVRAEGEAAGAAAATGGATGAAAAGNGSVGHCANFSFSSNCEYTPFEHPIHGQVAAVRVRQGCAVRRGCELTVDYPLYAEHAGLAGGRGLPAWFSAYGAARNEDGYYFHLRMSPPAQLARHAAGPAAHAGGILALQHGPWRVLYLGAVEQGMTYVPARAACAAGGSDGWCEPSVIGFEYVRTAAAAGLAFGALWQPPQPPPAASTARALAAAAAADALAEERARVLCIGLGAGSLPLWCAHHCVGLRVLCIELHPLVAQVAAEQLRNPLPFELLFDDGAGAVGKMARAQQATRGDAGAPRAQGAGSAQAGSAAAASPGGRVRCIFLDAYDSQGRVPAHLQGRAFLADCAALLCPELGLLVANVWHGAPGSAQHGEMAAFARAAESEVGPVWGVPVHGQEANLVLVALRRPRAADARGALPQLTAMAAEALAHARAEEQRPFAPEVIAILERLAGVGPACGVCSDPGAQAIIPLEQLLRGQATLALDSDSDTAESS